MSDPSKPKPNPTPNQTPGGGKNPKSIGNSGTIEKSDVYYINNIMKQVNVSKGVNLPQGIEASNEIPTIPECEGDTAVSMLKQLVERRGPDRVNVEFVQIVADMHMIVRDDKSDKLTKLTMNDVCNAPVASHPVPPGR